MRRYSLQGSMGVEPCSSGAKIKVDEFYPTEQDEEPLLDLKKIVNIRSDVKFESCYEITRHIGDGKFGKVFQVKDKTSGQEFAAKFIKIRKEADRQEVEREVSILTQLRHPRIAQIFDAFYTTTNDVVLIMEIVRGGELFDRVADESYVLTEQAVAVIICQLCEAIEYIHQQNILHLDIKPENIMCISQTGNRIKLIDFGLARHYDGTQELKYMAGTPEFAAPEVIKFEKLDYHTDMWSVGVITYILLSGYSPFLGDNLGETYCNVEKGVWEFTEEFETVTEEAKDFISKLLIYDRRKRMLPDECLKHPWIAKHRAKARCDQALEKPAEGPKIDNKMMMRYNARRKFRRMIIYVKFLIEMNRMRNSLKERMSEHGQKFFEPLLKVAEEKEKKGTTIGLIDKKKLAEIAADAQKEAKEKAAEKALVAEAAVVEPEQKKKTIKKQKSDKKSDIDSPPKKKASLKEKTKKLEALPVPVEDTRPSSDVEESKAVKPTIKKFSSDAHINKATETKLLTQRTLADSAKTEKRPQKTESSDSTKENRIDGVKKAVLKKTPVGLSVTSLTASNKEIEERRSSAPVVTKEKAKPMESLVKSRLKLVDDSAPPLLMNVSSIPRTKKTSLASDSEKSDKDKSDSEKLPKLQVETKKLVSKKSVDKDGKEIKKRKLVRSDGPKKSRETDSSAESSESEKKKQPLMASKVANSACEPELKTVSVPKTVTEQPTATKTVRKKLSEDTKTKEPLLSVPAAKLAQQVKEGESVDKKVRVKAEKEQGVEVKKTKKVVNQATEDKDVKKKVIKKTEKSEEKDTKTPTPTKTTEKTLNRTESSTKKETKTSPKKRTSLVQINEKPTVLSSTQFSFTHTEKKNSKGELESQVSTEKRPSLDKKVRFAQAQEPAVSTSSGFVGLQKTKSERCVPTHIQKNADLSDARKSKDDQTVGQRKKPQTKPIDIPREEFSFDSLREKLLRRVSNAEPAPTLPRKECVPIAKTHTVKERLQRFSNI